MAHDKCQLDWPRIATAVLVLGGALSPLHCAAQEADISRWPGFLGAGASELKAEQLPLEWGPDKLAWSKELAGYGQSAPVIWNNRVFVTSAAGKNKEKLIVACHSLEDGKQLWKSESESTFPEKNTVYISRAAPTPVIDDKAIYCYFESGDVVALSHEGKVRWSRSLTKDYGKPANRFGLSASPAQTEDLVIVLIDDSAAAYLAGIKKTDGTVAWKTDREPRTSWSSPAIIRIADTPQVVCSSAGSVDGYDPKTGKQLWTYAEVGGNTGTTPIDMGDGRFLTAASGGRGGENAVLAKKSNGLMVVEKQEGQWKASYQWLAKSASPSWASPVAHQGHAYWINRVGALYCIDLANGKTAYTQRVKESCWATPISAGDRLYLFGKSGSATVIAGGSEFKVLAENRLWADDKPPVNNLPQNEETDPQRKRAAGMFSQPVLYGVAAVNDSFVMRTGSMLYCIRK